MDRTHHQLRALDALRPRLSYPGHSADVREAERKHVEYPILFNDCLEEMRRQQTLHDGAAGRQWLRRTQRG